MTIILHSVLVVLMFGWLLVPAAAQATRTPTPKAVSGFSVALVEGFLRGAPSTPASVMPAVWGRALSDIKDVLPYTSYRLVDNQWILSSGRGRVGVRLSGAEGEEYGLTMHTVFPYYGGSTQGQVPVVPAEPRVLVERFLLTGSSGVSVDDAERDLADTMGRFKKGLTSEDEVGRAMQRLDAASRAAKEGSPGRTLIDTSFVMDVGETVVVGTSRVQGDRAIIVLLSAAGK